MNPQQVLAFNNASGTTSNELLNVIVTVLFVMAIFWAVMMMIGKLKSLVRNNDIDMVHMAMVTIRVLAVLVIILFLVNV
jgi:integrating conjugative element protein (TIGR03758 family)